MTIIQLFFGQDIGGKEALSKHAWNAFLRDAVTPRFPDGFTVFDSYGQWRAPDAKKIGRERSKMIEIAAVDTPEMRKNVEELASLYRARFHQQSVGIVTMLGCGAF
jgi:hypothetical protein